MSESIPAIFTTKEIPAIFTTKEFATKQSLFNQAALWYQVLHADKNGLNESGALIRIGKKVLWHEAKFYAWVESKGGVQS